MVLTALLIGSVLVVATITLHYEALRLISAIVSEWPKPPRLRILIVVIGCFAAHILAIGLYAVAYATMHWAGFGTLTGELENHIGDYLYFSASSYSTLGFGDVTGTRGMRLISALEAVNGLFLIAWSTSFTYLAMERLWPLHTRIKAHDGED